MAANVVSNRRYFTVGIICFINLINYMDRYTIAGILYDIQQTFHMSDAQGGLLQTAFIFVYMFMAPLFGYLGDRYNRKWLLTSGILFWSLSTLAGSFMPNYGSFLALRCLVGVGEASYTTVAPTIISDYFVGNKRSQMLSIFNFAIPTGAGLGYMLGSVVLYIAGHGMTESERISAEVWRWGLRITPILGIAAVMLIIFLLDEPPRGESEGGENLKTTSLLEDLTSLVKNKSFVLNTLGFTAVTFVMGALAWWAPLYIALGIKVQETSNVPEKYVSLIFGFESMVAGLIGVPLGSYIGQRLRVRFPKADPLVCGIGILFAAPILIATLFVAEFNTLVAVILCFIGQILQNLNWSVVTDMMLYTVIPTRRSSASALLILVSHTFGDAGSPYLTGVIAEAFKSVISPCNETTLTTEAWETTTSYSTEPFMSSTMSPDDDDPYVQFKALQYSLAIVTSVDFLAIVFFVWLAFNIVSSKNKVDNAMKGVKMNGHNVSDITGHTNPSFEKSPETEETNQLEKTKL